MCKYDCTVYHRVRPAGHGTVAWLASHPTKRLGATKQDGSRLNGHHCEPAITRKRQRFSKIHESNRNIFTWRSHSCLSCGVEVNAVPDDRMNDTQNNYRNPSCRGLMISEPSTVTEALSQLSWKESIWLSRLLAELKQLDQPTASFQWK